jgi:hypothetical protein
MQTLTADNLQTFDNSFKADEFNEDYRCSACWGVLVKVRTEAGAYLCQCENCKEKTPGYVTANYVNKCFEKDLAEASEARYILRNYLPHKELTEEQIMQELGF